MFRSASGSNVPELCMSSTRVGALNTATSPLELCSATLLTVSSNATMPSAGASPILICAIALGVPGLLSGVDDAPPPQPTAAMTIRATTMTNALRMNRMVELLPDLKLSGDAPIASNGVKHGVGREFPAEKWRLQA